MGVDENMIRPVNTKIYAFDGSRVNPIGTVALPVYVAERILLTTFFIVDTPAVVNAIMGREWIHSIEGVVSTLHQLIRCSSPDGQYTIDIKGDSGRERGCFSVETTGKVKRLSQEHFSREEKKMAAAVKEDFEGSDK